MLMQEETQLSSFQDSLRDSYLGQDQADPMRKLRAKAWDRFLELGLPDRKDEVFRYLRWKPFYEQPFQQADLESPSVADINGAIYPECRESVLVFVNGRFVRDLSNISALPGNIVASPLSTAMRPYGTFLNNRWNSGIKEEDDPFVLLNTALQQDGLLLYIPPKTVLERPIQILNILNFKGERQAAYPRLQLFVGSCSEATVLCNTLSLGQENYFVNQVIDVVLDTAASLKMSRTIMNQPLESWHMNGFRAALKKDSRLRLLDVTDGTRCMRNDCRVAIQGENAEAFLHGASMLMGKRECHNHIFMDHQAPNCISSQLYKGVLGDQSRSSFEGKIYVHKEAQKTDAFQLNNHLLLSKRAEANSKPNLEIFADDVKASHGATVGQLEEEQLFYLRTRGLCEGEASTLLVQGFLKELIDEIPLEEQRAQVYNQLKKLLAQLREKIEDGGSE